MLAVLEAERFTRKKKQWSNRAGFEALLQLALDETGYTFDQVTHWSGSAMGNVLLSHEQRRCDWTTETTIRLFGTDVPFLAVNHHLAHAASFFASPYDSAVVDACDGGGDGRQHVAYHAQRWQGGARIRELSDVDTGAFTGVFYDVCSFYLYDRYCQEGKFMGLAPYGEPDDAAIAWLSARVDRFSTQPHEVSYAELHERFGIDRFDVDDPRCANLAKNVQTVFEAERVKQLAAVGDLDGNIVLSGGSALNIHANTAIRERFPDSSVYVAPCCDDTGQAIGALLYQANVLLGVNPKVPLPFIGLGSRRPEPEVTDAQAERVVADLLDNRVVAWHWGRAEIGPRALGHRSLLCAPFTDAHRQLVSEKVKRREAYRPVAPVLLTDRRGEWFGGGWESPYMLFADQATPTTVHKAAAVVHVDGSARIQTIDDDHVLGKILRLLDQATGVPMLINTSLNGPGEPIVQTHEQTLAFCAGQPDVVPYLEGERR
ncbi:carbamoyltransferase C-terminal domain-containing protein [Krasilnikovia sp. M28-CT-15]|uniref:carbamoyltransferase C-terminal domain-containing protein n=1 Tax=Krasilnikovia sp. M28-CT-15 TaxID=3373540 RepID=UPI00399C63BC